MKDFLRVLFTPSIWFRINGVSKGLDRWMVEALDNPVFSEVSRYTCKLNGKRIWIANYPYAFGSLDSAAGLLPRRGTALALRRALMPYALKETTT